MAITALAQRIVRVRGEIFHTLPHTSAHRQGRERHSRILVVSPGLGLIGAGPTLSQPYAVAAGTRRSVIRSTMPAKAPPITGAMMNSQTCARACPPTTTAGPKERAGFTDRPVTLMNGKCKATSVRPTISPARGQGRARRSRAGSPKRR